MPKYNNMYVIKIFCDFADSHKCKSVYEKICGIDHIKYYGSGKQVFITDGDDYTHAIIINKAMPDLNIPKENVIGLAFEPYEFVKISRLFIIYAKMHIGKYFIGDKRDLPDPFIEHFGYMWHTNPKKSITYKPKIMSICVSEKVTAPGHLYRHQLIEEIIRRQLPVDIYGRGSYLYKNYRFTKGVFKDTEPYENYLFSICIENFQNNHYISEKCITPLLHNCMPIYSGCINAHQYFGNDMILLTNNINQDIDIILSILNCPFKYYKKTYTKKNRKTVNFIRNIKKLFTPLSA